MAYSNPAEIVENLTIPGGFLCFLPSLSAETNKVAWHSAARGAPSILVATLNRGLLSPVGKSARMDRCAVVDPERPAGLSIKSDARMSELNVLPVAD
jgi:hypothetical protein